MRRFEQEINYRDDHYGTDVEVTVVGILADGMPEWCMSLVDISWPAKVGAADYDEDEFEAFFPGLAEKILGEVDDDEWQEVPL